MSSPGEDFSESIQQVLTECLLGPGPSTGDCGKEAELIKMWPCPEGVSGRAGQVKAGICRKNSAMPQGM